MIKIDSDGSRFKINFNGYDPQLVQLVKTIPGRRFEPDTKAWNVPASPLSAKLLKKMFPDSFWSPGATALDIEVSEARVTYEDIKTKGVSDEFSGIITTPTRTPRPFQKEGAFFAKTNKRVLIADDIGVGKSLQALMAAASCDAKTVLIVCPKFLIPTWMSEIAEWTGKIGLPVTAKNIDEMNEKFPVHFKQLAERHKYTIINYEMLGKLTHAHKFEWDMMIVDEAHFLKTRSAKRSVYVKKIKSKRAILMTGSPILNRPIEIWNLLDTLSPGEFGSFSEFGDRYAGGSVEKIFTGLRCAACGVRRKKMYEPCFNCHTGAPAEPKFLNVKQYNGSSNLDELHERLKGIMIRRRKRDVLKDLPPLTRIDKKLVLEADELKKYNTLMQDLFSYLTTHKGKDPESAAKSCFNEFLTRIGYARQLLSSCKVDVAVDDALQMIQSGESVVVFAEFKNTVAEFVHKLKERIKEEEVKNVKILIQTGDIPDTIRALNVIEFQKHSPAVFVATLDAAGIGLTLTNGRYALYLDLPWEPAMILQAEGRIDRNTQARPTFHIRYFFESTYDIEVMEILKEKQSIINQVVDGDGKIETGEHDAEKTRNINLAGELIKRMITRQKGIKK